MKGIHLIISFFVFRTSDQLLEELFGAIGAKDVFLNDEPKKKKKKKRKHSDDEEGGSSKKKKSKKSKKVKDEPKSDGELSDEVIKKIKKEKKDKEIKKEKEVKKEKEEVTERRKLSIVIKDFKIRSTSDSRDKDKEKEKSKREKSKERSKDKKKDKDRDKERERRSKDKKKSRDRKSGSDFSLSDEETYRNLYEYHMSSRWIGDDYRDHGRVREWDRDKYYHGGRRYDDDRYSRRVDE